MLALVLTDMRRKLTGQDLVCSLQPPLSFFSDVLRQEEVVGLPLVWRKAFARHAQRRIQVILKWLNGSGKCVLLLEKRGRARKTRRVIDVGVELCGT